MTNAEWIKNLDRLCKTRHDEIEVKRLTPVVGQTADSVIAAAHLMSLVGRRIEGVCLSDEQNMDLLLDDGAIVQVAARSTEMGWLDLVHSSVADQATNQEWLRKLDQSHRNNGTGP